MRNVRGVSERITPSSGNVFADLGLSNPEDRLVKAKLVHKLAIVIKSTGFTQRDVAKRLGVDQPKISELLNGRTKGYSIDRLFQFLLALDQDVMITVRERKGSRQGRGRISVA